MNTIITKFLSVSFILFISLFSVQPVFAHGDDARIEISSLTLNPGGVLEIRGVAFESETEVALALVDSQVDHPLGVVTTDTEGVFQLITALPVDLVNGAYVIRGTTADGHSIDSPELTITGSADLGSGAGQPREEEDGLLAPMPTLAAGAPTPVMSSVLPTQNSVDTESSIIPSGLIAVGVGIAVILVFILILKRR